MRTISYQEALVEGLREELLRDQMVICLGQDIGIRGGPGGSTKGLYEEFGPERIIDTPISEMAMTGAGVGAAMLGMRPVVEVTVAEFLPCCMTQLVHDAPNVWYHTLNEARAPVVYRVKYGIGYFGEHAHSFESWFMHVPGLKIVMPSTPYDAKGLLKSAVRDDNPILFFEHFFLYNNSKGPVPEEDYTIPLGKADIKLQGNHVTVIATGLMVSRTISAAETLHKEGVSVEVIDPRTIAPLDKDLILTSVKKTGRLVIVHEARKIGGMGSEISATVNEEAFSYLKAPIIRVGAPHVPNPYSKTLEEAYVPSVDKIIAAIKMVIKY
jgi:acetoin:2,6-dichlorophenolindophenol oxidoreductase subunit beta